MTDASSTRETVIAMLAERGILRHAEIRAAKIHSGTISRLVEEGTIVRLARGLYQLPDAEFGAHHTLAEAAKRVAHGVVCLTSALAYHDLTDRLPAKVWMAIGQKGHKPRVAAPAIRFVRFTRDRFESGLAAVEIEGVQVRVTDVPHTIADLFRHRNQVGIDVAVEGLKSALRTDKASPTELAQAAQSTGAWTQMRPYMEALTIDG